MDKELEINDCREPDVLSHAAETLREICAIVEAERKMIEKYCTPEEINPRWGEISKASKQTVEAGRNLANRLERNVTNKKLDPCNKDCLANIIDEKTFLN